MPITTLPSAADLFYLFDATQAEMYSPNRFEFYNGGGADKYIKNKEEALKGFAEFAREVGTPEVVVADIEVKAGEVLDIMTEIQKMMKQVAPLALALSQVAPGFEESLLVYSKWANEFHRKEGL